MAESIREVHFGSTTMSAKMSWEESLLNIIWMRKNVFETVPRRCASLTGELYNTVAWI